ncbi:MAG TPA: response regulator transcription factor [Actinomycetota bacterium]|nr:response regulator transcription factor [Actinomycetota bacterium]
MSSEGRAEQPPPRVLVVEDDAPAREALVELLGVVGFEVVGEVEDGAHVEEAVARLRPDVVLLDAKIPTVPGVEVTRRIVRGSSGAHVVFLSAYDDDRLRAEALAAGAVAYLVKGCPPEEIEEAILRAAGRDVPPG